MSMTAQRTPKTRAPLHRVSVTATERLTPNMQRLTFEGEGLATLAVPLPAQWLKVVLSAPGVGDPINRAYTIRRFYPNWGNMEVDFVLHGDTGLISKWAQQAMIGDVLYLGNPRGGHCIEPDVRWRLLAGDETALPAIASILESLPADGVPVVVAIEVPSAQDVQCLSVPGSSEVHWLSRDRNGALPGCALERAISDFSLPDGAGQVFLAGEAASVKRIKQDISDRAPQAVVDAKGYWLMGQADYRN